MFLCLSLSFTTFRLLKSNGQSLSHVAQFGLAWCFLTIQFRSCLFGETTICDSIPSSASYHEPHDVSVPSLAVPTWITCSGGPARLLLREVIFPFVISASLNTGLWMHWLSPSDSLVFQAHHCPPLLEDLLSSGPAGKDRWQLEQRGSGEACAGWGLSSAPNQWAPKWGAGCG